MSVSFNLERNALGRLVFISPGGTPQVGVVPVRAFPIAAPDEGLSLVGPDGRELVWIDRLDALPADLGRLIDEELARREFVPVLTRLLRVSSFSTPCTWEVDTDRGPTRFVLKGEEDIRRITRERLLIASSDGLQFAVPDVTRLDRASRKLIERFL